MKLTDAYKIVKGAVKSKIPVMLWGAPGIGKSSIIQQIAKETNNKVVDLRLAQLEPTDLRGVPMPNRDTGRAEWFLPAFWPTPAKTDTTRLVVDDEGNEKEVGVKAGECVDGPGIIFLDEIEKAPVSVKNASLQLVLDRMVGSYKLPDDWAIVCAGNREEDGAFSQPLGSALSNRMIHLEVEADIDAWATWARENDVVDDIIGFLHFKPELLYRMTDEHAFPTPRSWVIGSRLISSVKSNRDQKELLSSAVGRGTAQEFTVWSNVYKSVDPEAILDNGQMPDFSKSDQSFKYAVTMAVAFYLRKRKNGIKKVEQNTANFLKEITPELRVIFLKTQNIQLLEKMAQAQEFKDMIKDIMRIAV